MRATYRISLADAWIAACAALHNATALHKDSEFESLPLAHEPLPYKE